MAAKKVSKGTADKLAFSRSLGAALEVHGEQIAKKAAAVLFPDGKEEFDCVELIGAFRRMIRRAEERFEAADAAHLDELADDDPLRVERDLVKREVLDAMLSARATVTGAFGLAVAKSAGLVVVLEDRPDLVEKQAMAAVRSLRAAETPKRAFADAKVDLARVADELEAKAVKLRGLLDSLDRERREAEKTLNAREQAEAHWRGVTGLGGAVFEMMAEIAGEHRIAEGARPTVRRRAGILDDDIVDPTGDGPAEPATDTDPNEPEPAP
ncbi:MAG TPA: hypothetical protein VIL20_09795 [Sandaracinaceae bacterium]